MNLTSGNIQVSNTGKVFSGKSTYGAATAGWFLGIDGGVPKFKIGNAAGTKELAWDGTELTVAGDIIGTGNVIADAITERHYASTSGTIVLPGGNTTTAESVAGVQPGNGVDVLITASCGFEGDTDVYFMTVDVSTGGAFAVIWGGVVNTTGGYKSFQLVYPTASANAHTFRIRVSNAAGQGDLHIRDRVITAVPIKR